MLLLYLEFELGIEIIFHILEYEFTKTTFIGFLFPNFLKCLTNQMLWERGESLLEAIIYSEPKMVK